METTTSFLSSSNQKSKASRPFAGLGGYLAFFAAGYVFNLTAGPMMSILSTFIGYLSAYLNANFSNKHSLLLLCVAALVSPSIVTKFSHKSSRMLGFALLLTGIFISPFAAKDSILMSMVGHVLLGFGIGFLNLSGVTGQHVPSSLTMESRGKPKRKTLKNEKKSEMMNGQSNAQMDESAKTSQGDDDKLIEESDQVKSGPHEEILENPSQETNHGEDTTEANPDMHQGVESTGVDNVTNNDDSTPNGEPSKKKKKKNKKVPDTNNGDATPSGDLSELSTSTDDIPTNKGDDEVPVVEATPSRDPREKKMANNKFSALLNLES